MHVITDLGFMIKEVSGMAVTSKVLGFLLYIRCRPVPSVHRFLPLFLVICGYTAYHTDINTFGIWVSST